MSKRADELNKEVTGLIAAEIRKRSDDEIAISCLVVDIIRALNEAGYAITIEFSDGKPTLAPGRRIARDA